MKFRTITISSVFAFVLLAFAFQASAQKKEIIPVDFNRVKSVTSNPESRYYFPKLLHSYVSFNYNKFELEDMRNLYYGYMFQEDYNPYRQSVYADKVRNTAIRKTLRATSATRWSTTPTSRYKTICSTSSNSNILPMR